MRRVKAPARPECGASAVEAAIVTPVVFMMLFGIVEFGMLFKDYLGVQAMVRSGVRFASATPRTANFATSTAQQMREAGTVINPADVQELWVYKANTTNDFPFGRTNFDDCDVCVTFRWDAGTSKFLPVKTSWTGDQQNACGRLAGGPTDRIGVHLKVRHAPISSLLFGNIDISEESAMHLEPFPAIQGCRP